MQIRWVPYCDPNGDDTFVGVRHIALKRQDITGDLNTWDPSFALLLGNEATMDRQWHGALYLVAIYDRALAAGEIKTHFDMLRSAAETVPEP